MWGKISEADRDRTALIGTAQEGLRISQAIAPSSVHLSALTLCN